MFSCVSFVFLLIPCNSSFKVTLAEASKVLTKDSVREAEDQLAGSRALHIPHDANPERDEQHFRALGDRGSAALPPHTQNVPVRSCRGVSTSTLGAEPKGWRARFILHSLFWNKETRFVSEQVMTLKANFVGGIQIFIFATENGDGQMWPVLALLTVLHAHTSVGAPLVALGASGTVHQKRQCRIIKPWDSPKEKFLHHLLPHAQHPSLFHSSETFISAY